MICTYAPTEEASTTDKDTFYNNLTDCIREVQLHNFVVLLGDLNGRIGPSNTHLKTIGRYPYHKETNDNGNRLIIFVKQITCAFLQQEYFIQTGTSGAGNIQMATKHDLRPVILRGKWINSLCNCRCYNTIEIDSNHSIVTATVKFSFSTTKSYHI